MLTTLHIGVPNSIPSIASEMKELKLTRAIALPQHLESVTDKCNIVSGHTGSPLLAQENHFVNRRQHYDSIASLNNAGIQFAESSRMSAALQCFRQALCDAEAIATVHVLPAADTRPTSNAYQKWSGAKGPTLGINRETVSGFRRREYDEGMRVFAAYLRLPMPKRDTAETQSSEIATVLYNMGQLQVDRLDYETGHGLFVDALVMTEYMSRDQARQSVVPILHGIGYTRYRNGDFEKAIETFQEALVFSWEDGDRRHLAATLNCLGVLYFHLPEAKPKRSMEFLTRALTLQRNIPGELVAIATTLNNLGRVYYMEKRYKEALSVYSEALNIRRNSLGAENLDVAATVYNTGQTFQQLKEMDTAIYYYKDFLRIAIPKLGREHRDVCTILKCMAQIFHKKRDFPRALSLYHEVLSGYRSSMGEHAEVASIMNKIGNLHYEAGDFDSAIDMYLQGLYMEREVLADAHPNIAVTLSNIGQIFKQRGEYDSALRLYEEAFSLQVRAFGKCDPNVALTLSNIGLIYYQSGNFAVALEMYQEALAIRRKLYTESNLDVASSLNSIGLVFFKLAQFTKALTSFGQSLNIRRNVLGDSHQDVAIILYNVATVYMELGQEDEAVEFYRETIRVEKTALGPTHPDVCLTLRYVGQIYQQRGDLQDALSCFREILQIQRDNFFEEDLCIARTLNSIANLELQRGNTDAVVETMSDAARISKRAGGSEFDFRLCGFHLYGFAKLHPQGAAAA
ncbi:predicted protein [Phaeodactylum tricornutum CCAP 1055/1]|uniref:Uncharacterized protein n=1 Tax=Phaeodactylum tricornutum (strain CCAP 1055/1) TaxID=556484 RepID=B7G1P5_PHATC|nr:predicted protein [Phaeodactylum tricornutum CCAP 1055/1]EEC47720.1 predicted protein [Phaeodactylum tricornutum CCAP 1055/1]|eukprot:XP_002181068.1 predicted protein [Phaeodactylum tricornutum CCAP 1055/1]